MPGCTPKRQSVKRPNILFAISDDQSWTFTGVNGCAIVNTPAFDRIAREGVNFTRAFCAAPQCSPCRAAILTGRNIWQLEEAGTHASNFPKKFTVFTDLLEESGYRLGYTGKPWGPGNWEISGRERNPVGPAYNELKMEAPEGISNIDYAANFELFLSQRKKDEAFFFWYGCQEPHRVYNKRAGLRAGKDPGQVNVPPFLPDVPEIRSDLLDYAFEIDWFDAHLTKMMNALETARELDNTIIVVTSDNGMPFPRAKANLYDHGTRMPLAVRWPGKIKPGRVVDDFVSFVDFAPTFLQAAGLVPPEEMTGKSFLDVLLSEESGVVDPERDKVFTGRERHTHARPDNLGYPSRAVRTNDYLYILNLKPDRWPAGDPDGSGDPEGYHDIDDSPTKTFMIENQDQYANLFLLAYGKRPGEELYDIKNDPYCMNNLAGQAGFERIKNELRTMLEKTLTGQKDPRMLGNGDIFESYPRYSRMRKFKGFKKQGEYNPQYQ
ncbi:sulfatase [candidate division KSB1 bacterium]|nr:sulfatase [candidate division KSB1 bacterium]